SQDECIDRLAKHRRALTCSGVMLLGMTYAMFHLGQWTESFSPAALLFLLGQHTVMWVCVLAILGLGRQHLNFSNGCCAYLARASFPIYIFHQTWVIAAGYYMLTLTDRTALQVPLIIAASLILSFATYEIAKRLRITRFMFGIKTRF
ncbi:MAG: hypothetical protein ACERKO_09020, partial [Acetanaerobacterium sp.]